MTFVEDSFITWEPVICSEKKSNFYDQIFWNVKLYFPKKSGHESMQSSAFVPNHEKGRKAVYMLLKMFETGVLIQISGNKTIQSNYDINS